MNEHRVTVPRTARYFTLGPTAAAREVWFVLHGYGQLAARFLNSVSSLDDGSRLLVAPEALSRFYVDAEGREKVGASWMTREDRLAEIADYVRYLDAIAADVFGRVARAGKSVHVLGFSQGAAAACRWAALGATPVDRLLLWGGEVPPDLELSPLAAIPVTVVFGTQDGLITAKVAATIAQRLQASAIRHRMVPFDGGHEIVPAVLRHVAET